MTPPTSLSSHFTNRDIQILCNLERFRMLNTRQLQRLHFPVEPFGSHTSGSSATRSTSRVLNRLESRGAIKRLVRRIGGIKHGSALTIWQLGAAGDRFLRKGRGESTRRRFEEPSLAFARHTLAVADVAVALIEQELAGACELLALDLEPQCWRTFQAGSGTVTLKPDLAVVTADEQTETHSFVEVDLGTEHRTALLRKCVTYQRYHADGEAQQTIDVFPAIVWIAVNQERARFIREVIRSDASIDHSLFWVCTPETMLHQIAPYEAPPPNRKE